MNFELQIKQKALALGFDAVGITTAEPVDAAHVAYFQQWLDAGHAGEMAYLRRNTEKRFDPAKLLTGAKSVICVALNYRPKVAQASCLSHTKVRIANFAQYEDYHPFIKDRLFLLAEFIGNAGISSAHETKARRREPTDCDRESGHDLRNPKNCRLEAGVTGDRDGRVPRFKACVDSVPIAERALAQRAGLGFIGKNHMLIHPELGNQILLGELITTLELEPDEPTENLSCGDCGKCIRACPTGALGFDGTFDARKCISYLTIEKAGGDDVIPASEPGSRAAPSGCRIKSGMTDREASCTKNYIFGCDECILACPHELGKPERRNMDFQHHPEWQNLTADQILTMTEDEFQKTFANSGFLRLGLDRLKRNSAAAQTAR